MQCGHYNVNSRNPRYIASGNRPNDMRVVIYQRLDKETDNK